MGHSLTWQEAKAEAQQGERDVAAQLPADQVVSADQGATGVLLSCDSDRHLWTGRTIVTLSDDANAEELTRLIADHFRGGDRFEVVEGQTLAGTYRVQLLAPDDGESFVVREGSQPNELDISSASRCFNLPDDVYPGGDF